MIRVLLVEDHVSFRQALSMVLSLQATIEVVGEAGSIEEAKYIVTGFDVAVIDLDLPDGDGSELIEPLRSEHPALRVLILTASTDQADIIRSVERGASGLLHKSAGVADIVGAIERLGAGESFWSSEELLRLMRLAGQQRAEREAAQARLARLTAREIDVLRELGKGSSDREIALNLSISIETVKTHMTNILAKLEVESRLQALVFAVRHDVLRLK